MMKADDLVECVARYFYEMNRSPDVPARERRSLRGFLTHPTHGNVTQISKRPMFEDLRVSRTYYGWAVDMVTHLIYNDEFFGTDIPQTPEGILRYNNNGSVFPILKDDFGFYTLTASDIIQTSDNTEKLTITLPLISEHSTVQVLKDPNDFYDFALVHGFARKKSELKRRVAYLFDNAH